MSINYPKSRKEYFQTGYIIFSKKRIYGCIYRDEAEDILRKAGYDLSRINWVYSKWDGVWNFELPLSTATHI